MSTNSTIEIWPVEKLVSYLRNPRKNDAAVTRMAASLTEFGFKIPMLVRNDGEIVDGHLRLKAALKLGMTEVPIIRCDEWTAAQVKAFRLMVNRSATWAEWDEELLAIEFGELAQLNFDPTLTGFDPCEIDMFMAAYAAGDDAQVDSVPEVLESPVSVRGDLWLLGDHKLLVGDATLGEDVDRLMAVDRADLVLTDPPYNVAYEGYTEDRRPFRAIG
jgi:ParB-like chromosome segregation protein Spo0J